MDFEEYRTGGRARYVEFVATIRAILEATVAEAGVIAYAITGRAKDPNSLRKKLEGRGIPLTAPVDEALRDLAGCRIVFLMNSQVERFRNSGVIRDNFDVLNVNDHHPVPGTETEGRLFDSTNYTVQLKVDRAKLPEYRRFAGMKAEIQLQTLLNHAWAEMGHDTIYKRPELRHVDKAHLERIEERLNDVMRKHLLVAGHDFDKIARDFERLIAADRSAEAAIETIKTTTSSDALLTAMETIHSAFLPLAAERGSTFVGLVPDLVDAVERFRGRAAGDVETEFGSFRGKSGEAVARSFAKLLDNYRFADLDLTLETLVRLDGAAATDSEHKIWREVAEHFASHDLDAWESRGPIVQRAILKGIGKLEPGQLQAARGVIVAMLAKILSTEISGYRRGQYNTINIHSGTVPASAVLREIRSGAIDLLVGLLDAAADPTEQGKAVEALDAATRLPLHGGSEELRILVMEDTARVAAAKRARAAGWGLEARRQAETVARRSYRNFRAVPESMAGNAKLVEAQKAAAAELLAFRDALSADREYVLYRILTGRDVAPPEAWEDTSFDRRAHEEWRAARRAEIVDAIRDADMPEWVGRIRHFASEVSNAGDRVPLADFAALLAEKKPDASMAIANAMDEALAPLLSNLLLGFDRSAHPAIVRGHVEGWIADGSFLQQLADWLGRRPVPDAALLASVSEAARRLGDRPAVIEALAAASRQYGRAADRALIDTVILPTIDHLTEEKDADWIDRTWSLSDGAVIAALDETEARRLLRSFGEVDQISSEADQVLANVGRRFPQLVLDFFGIRLALKADGMRVDAIPFETNFLPEVLAAEPAMVVRAARNWYRRDPLYHEYRGARLVRNIFPDLPDALAAPLRELVERGTTADRRFVLDTLIAYDGAKAVYPLAMDVVAQLEETDELLGRVSDVLGERGVMTGEFGRVEADRGEFDLLAEWLEDPRARVKAYAATERRRLEQSMAWEQRQAELGIEQSKRDWTPDGEPETKA